MKQTRWGIVLSLGLAFAAGAAAGMFIDRVFFFPRGHHHPGPSPDQWEKDLGLSGEQKARMEEIFKKNDARIDALRSDFYKHLGEIRAEIRKEIDSVLTPEQKAKQSAMMEKFRKSRSKDSGARPSGPGRPPDGGVSKENKDEKESAGGSGDSGRYRRPDYRHFLY